MMRNINKLTQNFSEEKADEFFEGTDAIGGLKKIFGIID